MHGFKAVPKFGVAANDVSELSKIRRLPRLKLDFTIVVAPPPSTVRIFMSKIFCRFPFLITVVSTSIVADWLTQWDAGMSFLNSVTRVWEGENAVLIPNESFQTTNNLGYCSSVTVLYISLTQSHFSRSNWSPVDRWSTVSAMFSKPLGLRYIDSEWLLRRILPSKKMVASPASCALFAIMRTPWLLETLEALKVLILLTGSNLQTTPASTVHWQVGD